MARGLKLETSVFLKFLYPCLLGVCVLMDVVVHCGSIGDPIFDPGIHIATAMSPWPGCCLRQDVPEVCLDALQVYWTLHQADGSLFTW